MRIQVYIINYQGRKWNHKKYLLPVEKNVVYCFWIQLSETLNSAIVNSTSIVECTFINSTDTKYNVLADILVTGTVRKMATVY